MRTELWGGGDPPSNSSFGGGRRWDADFKMDLTEVGYEMDSC